MSEPSGPATPSRAPLSDAIKALYPFAPYVVVLAALWAAVDGADAAAWQPLLLAGAVLIDPKGVRQ